MKTRDKRELIPNFDHTVVINHKWSSFYRKLTRDLRGHQKNASTTECFSFSVQELYDEYKLECLIRIILVLTMFLLLFNGNVYPLRKIVGLLFPYRKWAGAIVQIKRNLLLLPVLPHSCLSLSSRHHCLEQSATDTIQLTKNHPFL